MSGSARPREGEGAHGMRKLSEPAIGGVWTNTLFKSVSPPKPPDAGMAEEYKPASFRLPTSR